MPFPLPKFVTRKKANGPFGIPAKWATNRLPTRKEVGAQYHFTRMEMEVEGAPKPSMNDVAQKVLTIHCFIFGPISFGTDFEYSLSH